MHEMSQEELRLHALELAVDTFKHAQTVKNDKELLNIASNFYAFLKNGPPKEPKDD